MNETRFKEIYEQAIEDKDPIRALGDLEFEIGGYLLKLLDKGEIKDPILVEKLMWYKAYNAIHDIENE